MQLTTEPLVAAVIQSNYIPWLGYFSMAAAVDVFIVYEDVQYTKNDWRNRNRIKVGDQTIWLTIPVRLTHFGQNFMETRIAGKWWAQKHYRTLANVFSRSRGWAKLGSELEDLYYRAEKFEYLYQVNRIFLDWGYQNLGIKSKIIYLDKFQKNENPTERLLAVLKSIGATHYLSGPSASAYIKEQLFSEANISIDYVEYEKLIPAMFGSNHSTSNTSFLHYLMENS